MPCKGHCKIGTFCDKLTGHCNGKCEAQWTGDFCEGKYKTIFENSKILRNI